MVFWQRNLAPPQICPCCGSNRQSMGEPCVLCKYNPKSIQWQRVAIKDEQKLLLDASWATIVAGICMMTGALLRGAYRVAPPEQQWFIGLGIVMLMLVVLVSSIRALIRYRVLATHQDWIFIDPSGELSATAMCGAQNRWIFAGQQTSKRNEFVSGEWKKVVIHHTTYEAFAFHVAPENQGRLPPAWERKLHLRLSLALLRLAAHGVIGLRLITQKSWTRLREKHHDESPTLVEKTELRLAPLRLQCGDFGALEDAIVEVLLVASGAKDDPASRAMHYRARAEIHRESVDWSLAQVVSALSAKELDFGLHRPVSVVESLVSLDEDTRRASTESTAFDWQSVGDDFPLARELLQLVKKSFAQSESSEYISELI